MFYNHPSDTTLQIENSLMLTPGLVPILTVINEETQRLKKKNGPLRSSSRSNQPSCYSEIEIEQSEISKQAGSLLRLLSLLLPMPLSTQEQK